MSRTWHGNMEQGEAMMRVLADVPSDPINNKKCSPFFVSFELVAGNIPALLFLIAGLVNFRRVRSGGFNRIVKYSVFFTCKLAICCIVGLLNFAVVIVAVAKPELIDSGLYQGQYEQCLGALGGLADALDGDDTPSDHDKLDTLKVYIVFSRTLSIIAWLVSYKLLIYLYRKGLSEFWYSHKLFWSLNAIVDLVCIVWYIIMMNNDEVNE